MAKEKLGEAELEVLRYVAEQDGATVREAAEHFALARGLKRTTVLTVMERLRKKAYLTREPGEGGFRYFAAQKDATLMRGLVGDFVERTLGGSLQPFVAYLAERRGVTAAELDDLRALVDALETEDDGTA